MKHLFWGIEHVAFLELSECLIEAKVYTTNNVLKQTFSILFWVIKSLGATIMKNPKPKKPMSIQEMYESESYKVSLLKAADRKNYMIETLVCNLKCKVSSKVIDDENSAMVTKQVSKILGRKRIVGLSHSEINQIVHSDFPAKKIEPEKWIKLYMVVSCLLLMIAIVIFVFIDVNKLLCLGISVASSIIWKFLCDRKLRNNALMKFVWLAVSEIHNMEGNMTKDNSGRLGLAEKFRVVHTLVRQIEIDRNKIFTNKKKVEWLKEEQQENLKIIKKSENIREKNDKGIENQQKQNEINSIIAMNNKLQADCEEHQNTCELTCSSIANNLKEYWLKTYPSVIIDVSVVKQIIYLFSYEDLDVIEKRFDELLASSLPSAIAKHNGNALYVEFRTIASGISSLRFQVEKGRLLVTGVTSSAKLQEDMLSLEELSRILTEILKEINASDILHPSEELQKYIIELESRMENEKKRTQQVIGRLNQKITDLGKMHENVVRQMETVQTEYDQVQELAETRRFEINSLSQKLKENAQIASGNATLIRQLKEDLDKKSKELALLEKKALKYREQIKQLAAQADSYEDNLKKAVEDEKKRTEKLIEEEKRRFNSEKEGLIKQVEQLNAVLNTKDDEIAEKESEINTNEVLYNKALTKIKELEKLKIQPDAELVKTKNKLEKQLMKEKESKKRILDEKNLIKKELRTTKDKFEQAIKKQNDFESERHKFIKEIQRMNNEINAAHVQVLQDAEIVDMFYNMIKQAKNSVFMMFPKMSYPSNDGTQNAFSRMKDTLKEAYAKNPRLKIVIYYGMHDHGDMKIMNQAKKAISEYKKDFGKYGIAFEPTNTHIKLVIADRECFILGSMNLLSSQVWEEYADLHHEIALLSKDKKVVDDLVEKYFNKYC